MAGAGVGRALLAAATLLAGACRIGPGKNCTPHVRSIGLDDANAAGMTARQIGTKYHIGDAGWSCTLIWTPLGSQTNMTWSPHDATTTARVGLRWGNGTATENTSDCPAIVAVDVILDVTTDDGGFADSWDATAQYTAGLDGVQMYIDPHAAGGFHGSYAFVPAQPDDWSQRFTEVWVSVDSSFVDGYLHEEATRSRGVNQGEGFSLDTAKWLCNMASQP